MAAPAPTTSDPVYGKHEDAESHSTVGHHSPQQLGDVDSVSDGSSAVPEKRGLVAAQNILSVITTRDIYIAYAAYFVLSLGSDFAQYTQSVFTAYATSAFKSHSQLSAAGVISRVFSIASYTIVPKLCDNIGRISPSLILFFVMANILSDALMGGCQNVQTYLGAQSFAGIGGTGMNMAIQIYIASTTNIVSRAFWNVAADSMSAIITMYSGAEIGGRILEVWGTQSGWRWGYGMWCLMNFVLSIPFIFILYSWHARARKRTDLEPLPPHGSLYRQVFHEYDAIGMVLMCGGLCLILVPVTMAKGVASKWDDSNIAMLCVGCALFFLFVIWSLPKRFRPRFLLRPKYPLVPWYTLKDRTVVALAVINMFDFLSYGLFTTYFQSFLQVAVGTSPANASQIDNTLRIVFQVTAIVVGALMLFWTPICRKLGLGERLFHTAWPIWAGIPIGFLGIGLDIWFVQRPRAGNAVACFVVGKLLYGIARGMFQTAGQVLVQAAAKRGELSIATGIFYMAMSVGGAIGVAIAGAIWNNVLPDQLAANLPPESAKLAKTIFGSIAVAIKTIKTEGADSEIGVAIIHSYSHTMKIIAIVATCLQVPMLVAMFFIKDVPLTEEEQRVEAGKRLAVAPNVNNSAKAADEIDEKK